MHRARALSSKVNNNRANGHCYNFAFPLKGKALGMRLRSWTFGDSYFSFDWSFSLPISDFLRFTKNKENLSSGSLNFLQNAPLNSVHLTLAARQFQMPLPL